MQHSIVIRPVRAEDARAFLEVLRDSIRGVASADYPADVIEAWAPRIDEDSIAVFLENRDNEVRLVAELASEIVGIGATVPEQNELRACYVSPAGLRQGVGSCIVQELERIARESGVKRFNLLATLTAEAFYNRLGYTSDREVRHLTSTGAEMQAIEMSKEL